VIRWVFISWLAFYCIAAESNEWIDVSEDFLEFRTGPGDVYPVFYTAEKGEKLRLTKKYNNWVLAEISGNVSGWITLDEVLLQGSSSIVSVSETIGIRKVAISYGWFEGSGEFGLSAGYRLSRRVGLDLEFRRLITAYSGNVLFVPKLDWQLYNSAGLNPFIEVGAGMLASHTEKLLVKTNNRFLPLFVYSAGVRIRAARSFFTNVLVGRTAVFGEDNINQFWDVRLELESVF